MKSHEEHAEFVLPKYSIYDLVEQLDGSFEKARERGSDVQDLTFRELPV